MGILEGMGLTSPTHILFVLVIALLVLGPKRLPEMAKAIGKAMTEFREAIGSHDDDEPDLSLLEEEDPVPDPHAHNGNAADGPVPDPGVAAHAHHGTAANGPVPDPGVSAPPARDLPGSHEPAVPATSSRTGAAEPVSAGATHGDPQTPADA